MTDNQINTIGIVGLGFVGKAIHNFFSTTDLRDRIKIYDKYQNGGLGQRTDLLTAELVFLCLPTPYDESIQTYDLSALYETCLWLQDHLYNGLVVIKSTVLPTTSQILADQYGLPIIHNPEFLTARTATRDFANQQHIVLGCTSDVTRAQSKSVQMFYKKYFPNAEISMTVSGQSEAMKVFCNSFYATKVQIFNEFYLLCRKLGLNYDRTRDLMLKNGWINPMHCSVPGPDGLLSYGGLCFVKDIKALIGQMQLNDTPCAVLEASIGERDMMRMDLELDPPTSRLL